MPFVHVTSHFHVSIQIIACIDILLYLQPPHENPPQAAEPSISFSFFQTGTLFILELSYTVMLLLEDTRSLEIVFMIIFIGNW